MPEVIDITGQRFGKLVALERMPVGFGGAKSGQSAKWRCQCDCGNTSVTASIYLRSGHTKSCGCIRRPDANKRVKGQEAEHKLWLGILCRCGHLGSKGHPRYAGKNISVHKSWVDSFQAFYEAMGPRPSTAHSLDRIDNNKGYEPGNVRWATSFQQSRNRGSNVMLTAFGRTMCLRDWADEYGLKYACLESRVKHGWDHERAVSEKPRPTSKGNPKSRLMPSDWMLFQAT